MKLISKKFVKVFTDGTLSFSFTCLKYRKQVIFYEKDQINSLFFQTSKKNNEFQNSFNEAYKLKYKV